VYRHILVATDGSALSGAAIRAGVGLARALGARVTGITVVAPYAPSSTAFASLKGFNAAVRKQGQRALAAFNDECRRQSVASRAASIVGGDPWRAILLAARTRKCDLIVMGSHGRSGLAGVVLGSEAAKVLAHADVPVLICR
jgi:nucleotide-binding universal stress UspA family protein